MKKEQANQIREQFLAGANVADIAAKYNTSKSSVYRCISKADHQNRKDALIKAISEDYLSGKLTKKEVIEKYGICDTSFYNYLGEYTTRVSKKSF